MVVKIVLVRVLLAPPRFFVLFLFEMIPKGHLFYLLVIKIISYVNI